MSTLGAAPAPPRPAAAFFYVVAAVILVLDQITKFQIVQTMIRGESRRVLGDFFRITYVHNDGAAFGLNLGGRWSFIIVTILVAAFILFYYARSERTPMARWALALILGGALGNLADRIRIGEVVDFLHLSLAGFSWPIFNVADIGVSFGVGLLALHLFRKEVPEDADGEPGTGAEAAQPDGSAGSGGRLDRLLAAELAGRHSRSELARLIRAGCVLLNDRPAKPSSEVQTGDRIAVELPAPRPSELPAEDLPVRILWEDEHLAVVEKPAGMVTHPAGPLRSGTLVNALLHRIGDLSGIGGVLRPGIVHRLDKGTAGLLVVAKNDESHRRLAAQLQARTLRRTYEAIAWGRVAPDTFTIDAPIARDPRDRKRMAVVPGGKEARSRVRVLAAGEMASHVEVNLDTGRTHQIRVHFRHYGHPLVGDTAYGGRRRALRSLPAPIRRRAPELLDAIDRPALHARGLGLVHPFTNEPLSFESPLPEDFREVLRRIAAERRDDS